MRGEQALGGAGGAGTRGSSVCGYYQGAKACISTSLTRIEFHRTPGTICQTGENALCREFSFPGSFPFAGIFLSREFSFPGRFPAQSHGRLKE